MGASAVKFRGVRLPQVENTGAGVSMVVPVVGRRQSLVVLAAGEQKDPMQTAAVATYNLVHKGMGKLNEDDHRQRSAVALDNLQGSGRSVQSRAGKPGLETPHTDRAPKVDHSSIGRKQGIAG